MRFVIREDNFKLPKGKNVPATAIDDWKVIPALVRPLLRFLDFSYFFIFRLDWRFLESVPVFCFFGYRVEALSSSTLGIRSLKDSDKK